VTKFSNLNPKFRLTGRLCERKLEDGTFCDGFLRDSVVNFGEMLPKRSLERAEENSEAADLTLVLGSSMRVTPACELPSLSYKRGGKFCICNLQKTPYDKFVAPSNGLRIFSKCDDFMRLVVAHLGIDVPQFLFDELVLSSSLENIRIDPEYESKSKYNSMSMAEDGPPPPDVLESIKDGIFLHKVRVTTRPVLPGNELGRVV